MNWTMFRSLRTNSISVTFQGATLSNSLNFLCLGLLSISKMIKKWTLGCFTELCTLSCFSHVWLSVTLWTVACQAPMSTGFSRQEYWSGLSFPSPGDLPDPGIEPHSPALQADSSLSEPPGKPKNTGVGSLSLLQGNFPTQGLDWDLPHYRQILYQLSY